FHHRDIDAHAGIERAQLLESVALLIGGWRQLDEPLDRRAPVSVKPDVVIVRTRTGGIGARKRPGETVLPETLTTFGLLRSVGSAMTAAMVAISTWGSDRGPSAARMSVGSMVGRSPCTLTTVPMRRSGSSAASAS